MPGVIFGLVVAALVALFSVQNASPVTISFLFWRFEGSLAIVIFLSALSGVLIAVLFYSAWSVRRSIKRKQRSQDL